jgi:5-(carboxyamino)imidazole ribonucleotide mutase
MPKGIPVGTVAIGKDGAINSALFAASILSIANPKIRKNLNLWRNKQTRSVKKKPR